MPDIQGSCGHLLSKKWYENDNSFIAVKDKNRRGFPIVSRCVVCKKCYKHYVKENLILKTFEEEELWMKG